MSDHALEAVRPSSEAPRPSWAGTAWRQFRLERRMFWRNPSAAFFNFLLPLLLLGMFGALFSDQKDLDVIVPGHRRDERDGGDVRRARLQPDLPARARDPQAAARDAAAVVGLPGRASPPTRSPTPCSRSAIVIIAGKLFFGIPWPGDWFALIVFLAVGVVCFVVARRRALARDPQLRVRARVRERRLPPDDPDRRRLLRRRGRAGVPARHRRGAAAQAPDRRAVGRDGLRRGAGRPRRRRWSCLALWAAVGIFLAVRGFSWEARRN